LGVGVVGLSPFVVEDGSWVSSGLDSGFLWRRGGIPRPTAQLCVCVDFCWTLVFS